MLTFTIDGVECKVWPGPWFLPDRPAYDRVVIEMLAPPDMVFTERTIWLECGEDNGEPDRQVAYTDKFTRNNLRFYTVPATIGG